MLKSLSTTALCLFISSSVALAQGAVLKDKIVNVSVFDGDGFKPVKDGAVLAPTDIVHVQRNSSAMLEYADGCRTELKAGRVVTVKSTLCAQKRELADLPNRMAEPAMPVAGPAAGGIGAIGGAPLLGGAVLAGAGIAAGVILATRQNGPGPFPGGGGGNGQPMSP